MGVAGAIKLTYEDFLGFPDDGRRHELIGGDHFVTPSPNTKHQQVSINLAAELRGFVKDRRLGRVFTAPFDVVLSHTDVIEPDVLFVSTANLSRLTEPNLQGPPDLVVEILSPSTRRTDEVTKRRLYERSGVREYWIVDPEIEVVKVYRLEAGRYGRALELAAERGEELTTALLPGFGLAVAEIFA